MSDMENNETNIVNLFNKNKEEKKIDNSKPINFVRIERDDNNHFFNRDIILNKTQKCIYIIKTVKCEEGKACIYSYRVEWEDLKGFLSQLVTQDDEEIIEISTFFPNQLA